MEEEVAVGHSLSLIVNHLLTAFCVVINHKLLLNWKTNKKRDIYGEFFFKKKLPSSFNYFLFHFYRDSWEVNLMVFVLIFFCSDVFLFTANNVWWLFELILCKIKSSNTSLICHTISHTIFFFWAAEAARCFLELVAVNFDHPKWTKHLCQVWGFITTKKKDITVNHVIL